MITLYGMTSPNVVKIIIALEELELPYRFEPVDVFKGENFRPEFLALNPSGKVPVIVDEDGPGDEPTTPGWSFSFEFGEQTKRPYTVFESGAILLYLAEKTGRLLPKGGRARYDALQWLMVQLTGVGPMFGQFVHFTRFGPKGEGGDYAVSRYRTQVVRLCELLEARLAEQPYLAGPDYSIADVATVPWSRTLPMLLGEDAAAAYPKLAEWTRTVCARPAVARAIARVDELRATLTPFDKAEPETLDRMFGRGTYAA